MCPDVIVTGISSCLLPFSDLTGSEAPSLRFDKKALVRADREHTTAVKDTYTVYTHKNGSSSRFVTIFLVFLPHAFVGARAVVTQKRCANLAASFLQQRLKAKVSVAVYNFKSKLTVSNIMVTFIAVTRNN